MSDIDKILRMIENGTITVEEGEKLINALNNVKDKPSAVIESVNKDDPQGFQELNGKIVLEIQSSNGENVKMNLPLSLASTLINFIPIERQDELKKQGFHIQEILTNISDVIHEIDRDIINIKSSNGDIVRIYIEKD